MGRPRDQRGGSDQQRFECAKGSGSMTVECDAMIVLWRATRRTAAHGGNDT